MKIPVEANCDPEDVKCTTTQIVEGDLESVIS